MSALGEGNMRNPHQWERKIHEPSLSSADIIPTINCRGREERLFVAALSLIFGVDTKL